MQKIVWWTGILVSIFFAQSDNGLSQEKWLALCQSALLEADSTIKITKNPADDLAIDVLQENLYTQIMSEINNRQISKNDKPSESKYQLLDNCQQYYPKATLRSDTLIIPYPSQKLDQLKEMKYLIPGDYFSNNSHVTLQPQIHLAFNPGKSTLMINSSYLLSYYRSPEIRDKSLTQYKEILQYIYNLLLPYTGVGVALESSHNKAIVHYKGYKEHKINLNSSDKFLAFWESLCGQGSLYFFPSKIDDLETFINVHGLLYVMKDDNINAYHFGELKVTVSKRNLSEKYELKLDFYPFVVNKQIGK